MGLERADQIGRMASSGLPPRRRDRPGTRWSQDPAEDGPEDEKPSARKRRPQRLPEIKRVLWVVFEQFRDQIVLIVAATVAGIVRASGITIQSGQTGLRFTFGRTNKVLEPGFHLLFPGLQSARKMPTRSRTIDLPSQRVVNREGFVYNADANVVYRVVDIRKALIEIDVLERGMTQMLTLGVQEVLRRTDRTSIRNTDALSLALRKNLESRLEPWGVKIERAGFPSIAPGPRTLRITQLERNAHERTNAWRSLSSQGVAAGHALGLVGTRSIPRNKTQSLIRLEDHRRRIRRLRKKLKAKQWSAPEIKRAELALLSRGVQD